MGAGGSITSSSGNIEQSTLEILSLFKYYDSNALVTKDDLILANESWNLVISDTSGEFIRMKTSQSSFEATSCLSWFYDQFYIFSAEMDYQSQELYTGNLKVQVRALVSMIQSTLGMFKGKFIYLFKITYISLTNNR